MSDVPFPRYNELPPKFLWFSIDQAVVVGTGIVLGALGGYLIYSLTATSLVAWLLGRWRASRPEGYFNHMLYWYGLIPIKGRLAINPFVRLIFPH